MNIFYFSTIKYQTFWRFNLFDCWIGFKIFLNFWKIHFSRKNLIKMPSLKKKYFFKKIIFFLNFIFSQ